MRLGQSWWFYQIPFSHHRYISTIFLSSAVDIFSPITCNFSVWISWNFPERFWSCPNQGDFWESFLNICEAVQTMVTFWKLSWRWKYVGKLPKESRKEFISAFKLCSWCRNVALSWRCRNCVYKYKSHENESIKIMLIHCKMDTGLLKVNNEQNHLHLCCLCWENPTN